VEVHDLPQDINDAHFAEAMAARLAEMIGAGRAA
jgi:hypothetical protein